MTLGRWLLAVIAFGPAVRPPQSQAEAPRALILVYHRIGSARADSMTVTTKHFEDQLDILQRNKLPIIPLEQFLAWRAGHQPTLPPRSIILTFDDGHISVYREVRSVVSNRRLPVTLFIYPSCISHATYAMTWSQLSELAATPYFQIESHTFWHPNFKGEAKRLKADKYQEFVDQQLRQSKQMLEKNLRRPIEAMAWPYGIFDPFLMQRAAVAGYRAAFSIQCRAAGASDPDMAIPRCLVSDDYGGPRFLQFVETAFASSRK